MPTNMYGFGTTYLGQRDFRPDGSYITTEFVIALLVPLVPLRSLRVIKGGEDAIRSGAWTGFSRTAYRITERLPLELVQVLRVYAVALACGLSVWVGLLLMGTNARPGPWSEVAERTNGLYLLPFIAWPFVLDWLLRRSACRRALAAQPFATAPRVRPASAPRRGVAIPRRARRD